MDPVTQAALGAAVGEAVLGHKIGRKAPLLGAALGVLPDLDIVIRYADPVASLTYHRGFSHSWLVHLMVSPLLAWLLMRLYSRVKVALPDWFLFVFLCLSTHAFLDACTLYGTQLFWPFTFEPVSWAFIFIIDPLYTVPLLVGVSAALILDRNKTLGHKISNRALFLSCAYLITALAVKLAMSVHIDHHLQSNHIASKQTLVSPMPFNILLWRIIAIDEDGFYEGVVSVFDQGKPVLHKQPSDYSLLTALQDHWPVQRLRWFTNGYFSVAQQNNDIVMSDIRIGTKGRHPFTFKVGEIENGSIKPVQAERMHTGHYDAEALRWVFKRITDETAEYQ